MRPTRLDRVGEPRGLPKRECQGEFRQVRPSLDKRALSARKLARHTCCYPDSRQSGGRWPGSRSAATRGRTHCAIARDEAMDLRKLKTLIELVESSGIGELEIQEGEERVRITRAGSPGPGNLLTAAHASAAPVAVAPPAAAGAARRARAARGPSRQKPDGRHVLSRGLARRHAVRRGRRQRPGGRPAVHHRGDEADERDRVRQRRAS